MIQKVGVAGAGAMGSGIAQVFALAGLEVVVFDVYETSLQKAQKKIAENLNGSVAREKITEVQRDETLNRIQYTTDINSLKADIIIEAVVEDLQIKQKLLFALAEVNGKGTILASNTSSIPITRLANGIMQPDRIVGMHFFNPAHIMKLVEVVAGAETSESTVQIVKDLALTIGKKPVVCKDTPGFIVNRVARHYYAESLKIVEEKVAGHEQIDALMESAGFKMGPFKLMDLIGNDVNFEVTSSLYHSFHQEARFRPSRIQQQKVEAGHLGKKSGKGFYNYF